MERREKKKKKISIRRNAFYSRDNLQYERKFPHLRLIIVRQYISVSRVVHVYYLIVCLYIYVYVCANSSCTYVFVCVYMCVCLYITSGLIVHTQLFLSIANATNIFAKKKERNFPIWKYNTTMKSNDSYDC